MTSIPNTPFLGGKPINLFYMIAAKSQSIFDKKDAKSILSLHLKIFEKRDTLTPVRVRSKRGCLGCFLGGAATQKTPKNLLARTDGNIFSVINENHIAWHKRVFIDNSLDSCARCDAALAIVRVISSLSLAFIGIWPGIARSVQAESEGLLEHGNPRR
ncbi:MAG: hypothetical protein IPN59_13510 [Holophaga sp.]|nr:hypothetical protein [Holophaga sp.]